MSRANDYKTKQRETILRYIMENRSRHVTVNHIVTHLALTGAPVGETTVYRFLDKLTNQGVVRKYYIEEHKSSCYQYMAENCEHHYHLKCLTCGSIIHLECDCMVEIDSRILSHHNFKLDHTKTTLYGQCEHCAM